MIDPRRLSPADKITIAYLLLTAPLFFMVPESTRWWRAALHVLLPVLVVAARRSSFSESRVGGILLDVYPILVFGYSYTEMSILNRAFHRDFYFDASIMELEQQLFGTQLAMTFRQSVPYTWVSEYLHFGYFSYYFYVPIMVAGTWWISGRRALRLSLATLGLTFCLGFVVFILVPVAGPYYEFPRMDLSQGNHHVPHLVRWVLDQGASIGTAFPSSHTSVAATVWIMCMRYCKPAAWVFVFMIPAMAFGAVYGGYHYGVDVLAGMLLGILSGTAGHALIKKL